MVSLVEGDVQCSGRTLASVRSQSAYGLIYCLYLKNVERVCDGALLLFQREIFNQRKCVYMQHQCIIETVNNEIKSSSNDLLGAK
jgi:hypothetical protein